MLEQIYIESENMKLSETGVEIFLQESSHCGKCVASAHIHDAIEILYMTKGRFILYINGQKHTAQAGDMVLLQSNTVHSIFLDSEQGGAYSVLKIKTSVLFDMASDDCGILYLFPFSLHLEGQKHIFQSEYVHSSGMYSIIQEMLSHLFAPQYASELTLKANAVRLCAVLLRYFERNQTTLRPEDVSLSSLRQIYEAMIYINNHFALGITAKECALRVNMSYTYFSRMFKKIVGKSFTAFRTETRIKYAEKELILSEKSVTEICFQCGFNDVSYFISQYKSLRGVSPYQFRKKR